MEVVSFQQPDLSFMPGNPYKNSLEGSGSMYSGQQSTRQLTDSEAASVLSMAAFMAFRSLASLAKAPGDFESLRDLLTSIDSLVDKSEARSMKDASIVPERSGISRIEEIESVIGDGHAEASDLKQIEQAPIEDPPMLPMAEDHADSGSMISNVEAPAEEPERNPAKEALNSMREAFEKLSQLLDPKADEDAEANRPSRDDGASEGSLASPPQGDHYPLPEPATHVGSDAHANEGVAAEGRSRRAAE
jgi:hypothetical protein